MSIGQQRPNVALSGPLLVDLPPVTPLNVPRRRTLCTDRIPQLPPSDPAALGHSRIASSSWATRRTGAVPITIDVGSDARPKIRPLPIPPAPKSAPPLPRRHTSHTSLRPLPCVPESVVSVSVTPASPLSPPTPVVRSTAHLAPPFTLPPPTRFASISLRLNTSPDALEPRESTPPLPSPPPRASPITEPPSPNTARQRRMSRLRRHLDESVQLELLPDRVDKGTVFGDMHAAVDIYSDIYSQTVVAVRKLLELDADDEDTSSDDDDDEYSLVLTHGQANRTIPVKRHSRKWIREKGGERFVEENYGNILRDLRAL
ncbi:hypothetical protein C8R44DRAFT_775152 [Mycena epipterygia]|nr:hypothetical protein C8R44DRAFT_775152 [Mycena epipterygia]